MLVRRWSEDAEESDVLLELWMCAHIMCDSNSKKKITRKNLRNNNSVNKKYSELSRGPSGFLFVRGTSQVSRLSSPPPGARAKVAQPALATMIEPPAKTSR